MLNEHEREEGPEDGEYHFSDEGGYEMGEEEAKAPVVSEASGLAAKFSTYRRAVIIGAIAAAVFLVAYLVIPPLTTSAPTEITAVNTPPPVSVPAAAPVPAKAVAQAQSAEEHFKKGMPQLMEKERAAAEKAKLLTHLSAPKPTVAALPSSPPAAVSEPALQPPSTLEPVAPLGLPTETSRAQVASAESKVVLERLTAMEETNTKVIGQVQAEYAQKVADYEAQNKVLQEQVRTVNTRLASMEVEMSKLVQALNNKQPTATVAAPVAPAANETLIVSGGSATAAPVVTASSAQGAYKSNYTVQAIIPGRAWLRAESGETITVAEGDVLKSLGRVTKIDPYDGTILIDTGGKLVTLTYGNGDYT